MAAPETPANPAIYSLPVVTKDGKRRVLLVNKRDQAFEVSVSGASGGQIEFVDQVTGFDPPKTMHLDSDKITLNGFAVAAVTLPEQTAQNVSQLP